MASKGMRNPFRKVKNIIRESDAIIEVVDARDIQGTRNQAIEKIAKGKRLVIAINKSDLIKGKKRPKIKTKFDYIFVSAKKRYGKKKLLELLTKNTKKAKIKVGILGYPDVGKSSLINYLKGKKVVKVAFTPGVTKGKQYIRLTDRILLVDSPGVYPKKERKAGLVLKAAIDVDKIEDPESVAVKIIKQFFKDNPKKLFKFYKIKGAEQAYRVLKQIAERRKLILKKGELNIYEASKIVIRDWQKGKLLISK